MENPDVGKASTPSDKKVDVAISGHIPPGAFVLFLFRNTFFKLYIFMCVSVLGFVYSMWVLTEAEVFNPLEMELEAISCIV